MIDIKYATNNGHNVVLQGDSLEVLKELEDNSIDSVVTDPPYGLSFMGKKWDYDVPQVALWKEIFRVLKPGGHLLSFSGTRTYHRMAVNIEDAGFEIRDQIMWVYGSGFPKSLNIGKQVDKLQGNKREVIGTKGLHSYKTDKGMWNGEAKGLRKDFDKVNELTKGSSEWEGWGTALKPAHEPIVVARKPLSEKNVALNVLKWGTGGINIDECRVAFKNEKDKSKVINPVNGEKGYKHHSGAMTGMINRMDVGNPQGRFPANFIHDGSEEVVGLFPNTKSGGGLTKRKNKDAMFDFGKGYQREEISDSGSAARFFYCAKASKSERNFGLGDNFDEKEMTNYGSIKKSEGRTGVNTPQKNYHPTVKPMKLMQYLVRLVTPKNGVVLDPFAGSGTTGCACIKEGFNCILVERDEEYIKIINARLCAYQKGDK